jgi:carbonic anhydrase/acetyltransferase-like protein (isoleucine patch superfamily)
VTTSNTSGGNVRAWRGTWPTIGRRVYIDPAASVIGQVTIGDDSSVWPMTVIRGDVNVIGIGTRSNIQDGSILHVTHDGPYHPGGFALTIGDQVTVGHGVMLHGCSVGNRCLIGMRAILMDGVIVEDEVVVGAGSLVTPGTRCEARSLYVGRPARRVRALDERELGQLAYAADYYVKVKDEYL